MNVFLISQCDKRALTESRRILDQFAERRGDRSWQTPITKDGLDTLRRMLRKTARKNTAVACHWIRGRDHSELLWIVGDAGRFNAEGAVPTNTTARNVLRRQDETDWHSLQAIHLMTALAALLHDLGKATQAFQDRLKPGSPFERNLYRHEWVSLRLFQAFVGEGSDDAGWLQRLIAHGAQQTGADSLPDWLSKDRLLRDGLDPGACDNRPLATLPPLAAAVGWLVLTHHRLPLHPADKEKYGGYRYYGAKVDNFRAANLAEPLQQISAHWNEPCNSADQVAIKPYWHFPHDLPISTNAWRKRAARLAEKLLALNAAADARNWLDDPYVMHIGRLSLMLADHHYSSLTEKADRIMTGELAYPLFANTLRKTGEVNQTLDEHLLGVEKHAGVVAHALPRFEHHLPRLARHRKLKQRSADPRFRWQDRAADVATAMRPRAAAQGAFMINMASTGCGKTLANARIMNALADPDSGMRCAFAMGLRTLTMQTGQAFRDLLALGDDELAVKVGGGATRELFDYYHALAERSGSASTQNLLPEEDGGVLYEGNPDHPLLRRLTRDPEVLKLLAAPILVCTIDHLTPATECQRGGRQIAPMLRLMSGDLALDEPDDFDIADLPALTRLVHWAGMLGSRVLLSSATLPPAIVEGLFGAYRDGRNHFQRNRGERPGLPADICCAWFDEYGHAQQDCVDRDRFRTAHLAFATQRHARLGSEAVRRRGKILPLTLENGDKHSHRTEFAAHVRDALAGLHAVHHSIDPSSSKRVSFGLVRMANIDPLFDVALNLFALGAPPGTRVHLCVYHARYPLLLRSAIEHRLDTALDRRKPFAVFDLPEIRALLDAHSEPDQLFVVLGSPVTEVGRDHDYDWAVVEPSSMRSLIQLAGRVRRHRGDPVEQSNLLIFERNLRHFENPGKAAFKHPGFEDDGDFRLNKHSMQALLSEHEASIIDARPRILPRPADQLQPKHRLVDLEHARLTQQMLPRTISPGRLAAARGAKPTPVLNAALQWSQPQVWLTGVLAQQQPFRADDVPEKEFVLLPDEDQERLILHRMEDGEKRWIKQYVHDDEHCIRLPDERVVGDRIAPWGQFDVMQLLQDHADAQEMTLEECAKRYLHVSLRASTQGWRFHPVLGFTGRS